MWSLLLNIMEITYKILKNWLKYKQPGWRLCTMHAHTNTSTIWSVHVEQKIVKLLTCLRLWCWTAGLLLCQTPHWLISSSEWRLFVVGWVQILLALDSSCVWFWSGELIRSPGSNQCGLDFWCYRTVVASYRHSCCHAITKVDIV